MRTVYSIQKSNCKMTSLVIVVHYLAVFLLAIQVESAMCIAYRNQIAR